MIQPPLVTIGIPTYNGLPYLREAVESALAQTYPALEVLVVDNASADETQAFMTGITDTRVRYIRNPQNVGMAGNFQRVLDLAEGRYLCLLPSDDLVKNGLIAWAVPMLEEIYPDATFAFSDVEFVGHRGGRRALDLPAYLSGRDYLLRSLRQGKNLTFLCASVFRREAAQAVGFEDHIFCDWTLWLRLARRGPVVYSSDALAAYRYHDANETGQKIRRPSQHLDDLAESIRAFLRTEQPDPEIQAAAQQGLDHLFHYYLRVLAYEDRGWLSFWRELRVFARKSVPAQVKLRGLASSVLRRVSRQTGLRAQRLKFGGK